MQKIFNITDSDLEEIIPILRENNLSEYKLDTKDFILYKENDEIVAFGRIYHIENNDYELSSLWVNPDYRGQKIGNIIMKDLIENKFNVKNNLFLGCKMELKNYYESVGFEMINDNFPNKFYETIKFAHSIGVIPLIMKLCKK